jgi:DNA-binding CsgD family transcriptional regulator
MSGCDVRRAALSDNEARTLALITLGRTNAEIADLIGVSRATLKTQVRRIYRKIGVSTRGEAIATALPPHS